MTKSRERRAHERLLLQVEVSLESASQLYTGLTGEISCGGVFVPTWEEIPIGVEADVALTLPNAVVSTRAVVRWRRDASEYGPPGIGVAFLEIDAHVRAALSEFCAWREPLYYDVA